MSRKNIKVTTKGGEEIELKAPVSKVGIMYNSPEAGKQHLLFVPDDPSDNKQLKYRVNGVLQSMADGSVEFVRKPRRRSKATRLAQTEHATLSYTSDDHYLVYMLIPTAKKKQVRSIILNESSEIAEAIGS